MVLVLCPAYFWSELTKESPENLSIIVSLLFGLMCGYLETLQTASNHRFSMVLADGFDSISKCYCFNMILNCSISSYPGYLQTVQSTSTHMVWNGSYRMFSIQYPGYLQTVHRTSNHMVCKWFVTWWFRFNIKDINKLCI